MRLNHTENENFDKSCIKLLVLTWVCVAVVIIADTLTVFIDAQYLGKTIIFAGFYTYVLIPGILNITILAIIHIASFFMLRQKKYFFQACLYIIGVTLICFVLARYNQDLSLNMIFFVIPVVLSMFYLDRKLLVFSLTFSIIAFATHMFIYFEEFDDAFNYSGMTVNIEVTLVLTIIIFTAGLLIIGRTESLHSAAAEANTRKNEDLLTGYLNHSGFYDDLDETFKNAGEGRGEFSLAILDIDNFTLINEEYGRNFGDKVIETIVKSINKALVNTATAYRYGGEEFVIICKGSQDIVINMVDTILSDFTKKTDMNLDVVITASAGICEYDPAQFRGKRDIFAALDEALYAAKRLGKNQYIVWNEAIVRDSFVSLVNTQ